MKKLFLLFIFITPFVSNEFICAQTETKFDFYLAKKQQEYAQKHSAGTELLPVLVKGNIAGIKQLVQETGGKFKYAYGNIASIVIPVSALPAFSKSDNIIRMEGQPPHIHPLNDTMRVRNHIVEVQQGMSPLPQAYKGKGIVIGFIDTGIDFKQPDFKDSSGTRVKYYWDMTAPFNALYTPSKFGYGQSWTKKVMDLDIPTDTASYNDFGHGSNVAGIAAGNGKSNGLNIGGASLADIVAVAYNFNAPTATMLSDAAQYIYMVADSLGEPCVINASLGDYDGSHDGQDLQALMIDSMILAKQPGRVFVAASGDFNPPYHLHDSLFSVADTSMTWFKYDAGYGYATMQLYANNANFSNVQFAIAVDKVGAGSFNQRAVTPVYNLSTCPSYLPLKNISGDTLGKLYFFGQTYNTNNYNLEVDITSDSTNYLWRLITIGPCLFDCWDFSSVNTSDIVDTTGSGYPALKYYKQPDTLETICSSFQCSPDVITTGGCYNRRYWRDSTVLDSNKFAIPGKLADGCKGPTRTYLIKPDITAAGASTLSTTPLNLRAFWLSIKPYDVDSLGYHNLCGGTSMCSPVAAATAALYMESCPGATYVDVWTAITANADTDKFTGTMVPNVKWGYGKIDAFKAVVSCITSTSPGASNKNNYLLNAYPNPFSGSSVIEYDFSTAKKYQNAGIEIYDIFGKAVKIILLNSESGKVNLDKGDLPSGLYFYSLVIDGSRVLTQKIEIM